MPLLGSLSLVLLCAACQGEDAPAEAPAALPRRGPAPVDLFHPERAAGEPAPEAAFGGTLSLHLEVRPPSLNLALENSTNTELVLRDVHETLRRLDWESWEWVDALLERRIVEETVLLTDGERLFGHVRDEGDELVVEPTSPENPLAAPRRIARAEVAERRPGTVYTYVVKEGILWQPAEEIEDQTLDARDVAFSASIYANPHVRCDEKRYAFRRLERTEILGPRTVRFTFSAVDFREDEALGRMTLLPSHLYDLSDPDNPALDPEADEKRQGVWINDAPWNRLWVGLGPWRVVANDEQKIEAVRFEGYFDPERAGYFDRVRWRIVPDAGVLSAMLESEIDFTSRVPTDEFFGSATRAERFTERFFTGIYYQGRYGALIWNTERPALADPRVRRALARAFDFEKMLGAIYHGVGVQVTGPMPCFSPAYDASLEPLAYAPDAAAAELAAAGWYDRDGDGLLDKDGRAFRIVYTSPAGHGTSRAIGLHLQEELARLGIGVTIDEVEFTAFRERQRKRDFDVLPTYFTLPVELDPEQSYGSAAGAPGAEGGNFSGLQDAVVDELIARGRRELDPAARMELWRELHRRLYTLQPYLFLWNLPVKFALARRVRGFQAFALDPGYSIRRWYLPAGTPGTRAERRRR